LLRLVCKDSTGVGANAIHAIVISVSSATDNDGVSSAVHGTAGTNDRAAGRVVQLLACSRFFCRSKMPQASVVGMFCATGRTQSAADIGVERAVFDTTVLFSALIGFWSRNWLLARIAQHT